MSHSKTFMHNIIRSEDMIKIRKQLKERITRGNYELEFRFHDYQEDDRGNKSIPVGQFNKLKKYLDRMSESRKEYVKIIDNILYFPGRSGRIRRYRQIIEPNSNEVIRVEWTEKAPALTLFMSGFSKVYPIRTSLSKELDIDPLDIVFPVTLSKKRFSYKILNGNGVIDMTITEDSNTGKFSYQVELELDDPNTLFTQSKGLAANIIGIIKNLYDTKLIYNKKEYKNIVSFVNKRFNPRNNDNTKIDNKILFQPRNLHLEDLVHGGIVNGELYTGEEIIVPTEDDTETYTVTHKADGKRKLLVIHDTGLWLVMAPNHVSYVVRNNKTNEYIDNYFKEYSGYILEGELIGFENMKSPFRDQNVFENYFYHFDTLSTEKGDCRFLTLFPRLRKGEALINSLQNLAEIIPIYISSKKFRIISNADDFFRVVSEMLNEQLIIEFETDGIMFTPMNMPYNSGTDRIPLKERKLTLNPDICKWKQEFSVDYKLLRNEQGMIIITSRDGYGANKRDTEFIGNRRFPFNSLTDLDQGHELIVNLPTGSIVEFIYDHTRNLLVPIRHRDDKLHSNRIDFAIDNWKLMRNPITEETLRGKNIQLMRQYHNKVKRFVFDDIPAHLTILDIGSGYGGDLHKLRQFNKGVLVEPMTENVAELVARVEGIYGFTPIVITSANQLKSTFLDRNHKFVIINTFGENHRLITDVTRKFIGGQVDVVSSMLSLSFFWESRQKVNDLVTTITNNLKPTGQFVFFTIDGQLVEQAFTTSDLDSATTDSLIVTISDSVLPRNDINTLQYKPTSRSIYIDLPGTIVQDQLEYLVYLNDLRLSLRDYGFKLSDRHRAQDELFLNQGEKILTSLYTFGKFTAN